MFVDGKNYTIVKTIEQVTMADSFVKTNKINTGHGEARLYLGGKNVLDYDEFFGGFANRCFFRKSDLLHYLNDAEEEYVAQDQGYLHDISTKWSDYWNEVNSLSDERVYFNVFPQNGGDDNARYYIGSSDYIFTLLREIALPHISYVAILLIDDGKERFNYFKLFMDYEYKTLNHPQVIKRAEKDIENDSSLMPTARKQLVNSRIGQGKFRDGVLKQMPCCPITNVNDERLLVASHIKPWVSSDNSEKLDPFNGLMLTPTYDKLFNDGYITFNNDSSISLSPYISPFNMAKLQMSNGKKYSIPISGREGYLDYHRNNIFKS